MIEGTLDLGHIVEGIVEMDPLTGRLVVSTRDDRGRVVQVDPQVLLAKYRGLEVRFTLASFDTLDKMAEMVADGNVKIGAG